MASRCDILSSHAESSATSLSILEVEHNSHEFSASIIAQCPGVCVPWLYRHLHLSLSGSGGKSNMSSLLSPAVALPGTRAHASLAASSGWSTARSACCFSSPSTSRRVARSDASLAASFRCRRSACEHALHHLKSRGATVLQEF